MWAKIDVFIFALAIATVTAMPSKQDRENEISVKLDPVTISIPQNVCEPNPCGVNAVCTVKDNVGSCACLLEYFGNPYEGCRPECVVSKECPLNRACINNKCKDPCPGVCGINAECRAVNHNPVCSCSINYTGNPFVTCNPIKYACLNNTDCSAGLACLNEKCVDPCSGTCGENAVCKVINHTPICSCAEGRTGDPFVKCTEERLPIRLPGNPCSPSPCGPNSICRVMNDNAVCSCLPTYLGAPPNCRPECIANTDCSSNLACINQKCVDPCPGTCGRNAMCKVLNNSPICSCPSGTSGDPFVDCKDHTPCLNNTECSDGLACVNKKCVDPCIGACGENAACKVTNRTPVCRCPRSIPIGDPFLKCITIAEESINHPCLPSPCGPNSICRVMNDNAVCSCLPTYLGAPPNCRPECIANTDCSSNLACINQKCVDPCPGTCGRNATCKVLNHTPVCSCPAGMSGNPFVACKAEEELKCLKNADCDAKEACIDQRCRDPCSEDLCGRNSECIVVKHTAVCLCPPGPLNDPDGPCQYLTADPDTPGDKSGKNKPLMFIED